MQEKPVSASEITMNQLMLPVHANALGNVHGGLIMKMVDETGAIAAMRHAGKPCVTIAIDSMTFHSPVHIGELVCCQAQVTYVGKSSIEVEVKVHAENAITGNITHTNSAYVVYVALDDHGRPTPVPGLTLLTDEERQRAAEAKSRQEYRLLQAKTHRA
ncbi:MAG: acyl-CoA thioesterase [Polyangiaceae bacterium]|nr:acyl-CoA thioesterase [Polyangiaceae bacterium]